MPIVPSGPKSDRGSHGGTTGHHGPVGPWAPAGRFGDPGPSGAGTAGRRPTAWLPGDPSYPASRPAGIALVAFITRCYHLLRPTHRTAGPTWPTGPMLSLLSAPCSRKTDIS